jgi:uncharacterized DUF497 family protein
MPDRIAELLVTEAAREKLGRREISIEEVQQLLVNRYVFMRAGRARRSSGELPARRLVVGQTDGGRSLTLVVERTIEPTTWVVVTGWEATQAERRLLDS